LHQAVKFVSRIGLGRVGSKFFHLQWVGLGQSGDGLGWIGSHKVDPRTTLKFDPRVVLMSSWSSVMNMIHCRGSAVHSTPLSTIASAPSVKLSELRRNALPNNTDQNARDSTASRLRYDRDESTTNRSGGEVRSVTGGRNSKLDSRFSGSPTSTREYRFSHLSQQHRQTEGVARDSHD